MKAINFLKIPNKQKKRIFKYAIKRKWTWKQLYKHYKQPPWCQYPDALRGIMGCFSLIGEGSETKDYYKNKCNKCFMSKYYNENEEGVK